MGQKQAGDPDSTKHPCSQLLFAHASLKTGSAKKAYSENVYFACYLFLQSRKASLILHWTPALSVLVQRLELLVWPVDNGSVVPTPGPGRLPGPGDCI